MKELPGFDIRYSSLEDEKHLKKWIEDPSSIKWFPMSTELEISSSCKNWIGFSKYKASLTASLFHQPCAIGTIFLMPYKKTAHQAMFYLIVDPKHRNKGIGFSILKNLLHLGKNYFRLESLHCEIYEGCPLKSLLEKQNFKQYYLKENFIKESENSYLARRLFEHFL